MSTKYPIISLTKKKKITEKLNQLQDTQHKPEANYKEKELDRIEPVSRAEALIPDDVILTRSGSLDTGYRVLDDATSREGR